MKNYLYALLLAGLFGCKVPYQPPVVAAPNSYLVVEGVINTANGSTDSTIIKLSRTSSLLKADKPNPELHAQVDVEDGQGFVVALKDAGLGNYVAAQLGLDTTKKYRLRIITADKKVYLSDLVSATYTPPIDSIGFTVLNPQVMIYVNAHNPANNTRYYRWDFTEDWEFLSPFESFFMTNGIAIVPRTAANAFPIKCWGHSASTNVLLGSTVKLASDVIYQTPVAYISGTSDKLDYRYSMQLKQYGLSQDAFKFWSQIQKNTEQLGTIFDAQPSQINGNIQCITNPAEPVFGYISVTNIRVKRVYINRANIPVPFKSDFGHSCEIRLDTIFYINPTTLIGVVPTPGYPTVATALIPAGSYLIPVEMISQPFINHTVPNIQPVIDPGYSALPQQCLDCSFRGPTKPPPWWVEN